MTTQIIAFSGKKCSGKDTSANFILGSVMKQNGLIKDFKITRQGKLYVTDIKENLDHAGIFDYDSNTQWMNKFKHHYLNRLVKLYSFADCLKKDICMKMLGLTYEQCYGTDEQKNGLTHLKWEDMPGVVTNVGLDIFNDVIDAHVERLAGRIYPNDDYTKLITHLPGFMTAREVMQFVGTEVMRKMYGDCHVRATMSQIQQDSPQIAIIRDTRFPNEVEGTVDEGGYVLRFLRDPNKGKDVHESETALDNYPPDKYLSLLDNSNMSIEEQNDAVYHILKHKMFTGPF